MDQNKDIVNMDCSDPLRRGGQQGAGESREEARLQGEEVLEAEQDLDAGGEHSALAPQGDSLADIMEVDAITMDSGAGASEVVSHLWNQDLAMVMEPGSGVHDGTEGRFPPGEDEGAGDGILPDEVDGPLRLLPGEPADPDPAVSRQGESEAADMPVAGGSQKKRNRKGKSGGHYCCVEGCHNNLNVHGPQGIKFYRFPSAAREADRRNKMVYNVGRMNADRSPWSPNDNSRLCSKHFISGSKSNIPTNPDFIPTVDMPGVKAKTTSDVARYDRAKARAHRTDQVNEPVKDGSDGHYQVGC